VVLFLGTSILITQAIAILNGFTAQKSRRWTGILARAYNNYGYLNNNWGRIHRSIDAYRKAIPLWRNLKSTGELANTLNNLGYALGLIGDYDNAQVQIRDGLGLREKQGLRPAVGFSLSTLAEVSVHAFASEIAIEQAERALTIFEWTDHPRGQGLALRTLAEAKRRVSGSPTSRQEKTSLRLVEEAEAAALKAVEIFSTVYEPIRLLWALTELGCVYREWFVRFPDEQTPKERDGSLPIMSADELFNKSNIAFREAAALAADRNLHGAQLDALISQYRLHYFRYGAEPSAESHLVRASIQALFDTYYPNSDSTESRFYTKGIHEIPRDEVLLRFGDWHTFLGKEAIDLYKQQGNTSLCKAAKHFFFAFRCYAVYSDLPIRKRRTSRTLLYEAVKTFNPSEMLTLFKCVERVEVEFGLSTSELKEFLIDQFGDQSQHFEFD
jgi:tetratricopeptide (TPR) repeat protein